MSTVAVFCLSLGFFCPPLSSDFCPLKDSEGKTRTGCALDCGAGIGRITKRLLLPLFQTVDLVDVTQEFLDKAQFFLGDEGKRVGKYICCGLQDFVPEAGRYDVIWIQWVIGESEPERVVDPVGSVRISWFWEFDKK